MKWLPDHALKLVLLIIFSAVAGSVYAQYRVEFTVRGIKKLQGTVLVAVYNSEETFLKEHLTSKKVKVDSNEVVVVFEALPSGKYAISTFHDENDNNKLDTNFLGIPNEPYGFSNNARGTFGPPSFEKATLKVDSSKMFVVTLE